MKTNIEQMCEYLEGVKLQFQCNHETGIIKMINGAENGNYRTVVKVEEGKILQIFHFASTTIPEGCRKEIAVAITQANYCLKVGKFELDLSDGELRYQASTLFDDLFPSDMVITRLLAASLLTLDKYMPAFLSVIYGNEPAIEAVALIEAN